MPFIHWDFFAYLGANADCWLRTLFRASSSRAAGASRSLRLESSDRWATLQSKMKRSWKSSITAQFLLNEPSIAPSRGP